MNNTKTTQWLNLEPVKLSKVYEVCSFGFIIGSDRELQKFKILGKDGSKGKMPLPTIWIQENNDFKTLRLPIGEYVLVLDYAILKLIGTIKFPTKFWFEQKNESVVSVNMISLTEQQQLSINMLMSMRCNKGYHKLLDIITDNCNKDYSYIDNKAFKDLLRIGGYLKTMELKGKPVYATGNEYEKLNFTGTN